MKNTWTEEIDRLRAVNGELLEACKIMMAADTPETIEGAYALMEAAIQKAEVTP